MKLTELKQGEEAVIVNIDANSELRNRLLSFGLAAGERLSVKGHSLAKQTIEIEIDGTLIALRREEADKIEVKRP
jgi:ferrous iron transport protein A